MIDVNMAPYRAVEVDGKTYVVRNQFEHHEPRPDLPVTAPENMVDGAHGCAILLCVNPQDEDDKIFVMVDAGFSPFDLVWSMVEKEVKVAE